MAEGTQPNWIKDEVPASNKPEPTKKPEAEKIYTYIVKMDCFREGHRYEPGQVHKTAEPQVSVALEPADEMTAKATEEKRLDFKKKAEEKALAADPAKAALAKENAEMRARMDKQSEQIAELLAKLTPPAPAAPAAPVKK